MAASQKLKQLRIKKVLDQRDVRWGAIIDLLSYRHKIPYVEADRMVRAFINRLNLNFNAFWFVRSRLTQEENRLILALCEVHGADALTLTREKIISAGSLRLVYDQKIHVEPGLGKGKEDEGTCLAEIRVQGLGKEVVLRSLSHVILAQVFLFVFAVLTYVVFVGAFLKGFATFLLLMQAPAAVTIAATRNFHLWVGLLCFLVGVAGIFGQAIRNTFHVLWCKARGRTLPV